MKLETNDAAPAVPGEEELLHRIKRLHKRDDRPPFAQIAVKNSAGDVRLTITAHTESEQNGVIQLLGDRQFTDELIEVLEEPNEEGIEDGFEGGFVHHSHPDFDFIFAPIKT